MGLRDELTNLPTPPGPRCSVAVIIEKLGDEGPELVELLAETHEHSAIVKLLKGRGFSVSAPTVGRHRRRQCSCP